MSGKRSSTGFGSTENLRPEDDQEYILKLLLAKRYWKVFEVFRTIKGTRVWEEWWDNSDLPLIIECVDEDVCGNLKYTHWMLVTKEHCFSCRPGKRSKDGEKTREVCFDNLPTIPYKIMKALRNVKG